MAAVNTFPRLPAQSNSNVTITCVCSPFSQCPLRSPTCESSIGCFHSVTLDATNTFVVTEAHGCFPEYTDQITLHCRSSTPNGKHIECCDISDGDLCNKNLITIHHRSVHDLLNLSTNQLLLVVLLPLLLLILGLLGIALLSKYMLGIHLSKKVNTNNPVKKQSFVWTPLCPVRSSELQSNCFGRVFQTNSSHLESNDLTSMPLNVLRQPESNIIQNLQHNDLPIRHFPTSYDITGCTSGSGSGLPFLVQSTIARQVRLLVCVGKGRFGEVWRAMYQGETVAVKIFSSRDEASWARETEVYNTGLLRHPNLLAYYASDMISRGGCTQLWLITAYHSRGCLHNYLCSQSLSLVDGLRLARSAAAGLAFLHTEITGFHAKPAIVHRDVKSKNILVRNDGEACLADLGLALTNCNNGTNANSLSTGVATVSGGGLMSGLALGANSGCELYGGASAPSSFGPPPAGPRVGTKRYMAPELLAPLSSAERFHKAVVTMPIIGIVANSVETEMNDAIDDEDDEEAMDIGAVGPMSTTTPCHLPFEVYQAADVYALGLVFWEILRRTRTTHSDEIEEYQIPFWNVVPPDPSFAQMRRIVAQQSTSDATDSDVATNSNSQTRPPISSRWLADLFLGRLAGLVQECWRSDWHARLPALRVRKNLVSLERQAAASATGAMDTSAMLSRADGFDVEAGAFWPLAEPGSQATGAANPLGRSGLPQGLVELG